MKKSVKALSLKVEREMKAAKLHFKRSQEAKRAGKQAEYAKHLRASEQHRNKGLAAWRELDAALKRAGKAS